MNTRFENKLSMYHAVQKVCGDNSGVWSAHPAFVSAVNALSAKITEIINARMVQESNLQGITTDKATKKETMAEKALQIRGAVQAWASDNNNSEVFEAVNFSPTEIRHATDTGSREICQTIYSKAVSIGPALAAYGVNATALTAFQNTINDYSAIISKPRTARSQTKSATANLRGLFRGMDTLIKSKLDRLVFQFKSGSPDFFRIYFNARIIVDLGIRHEEQPIPPSQVPPGTAQAA